MVIDSSALIAIVFDEPEAEQFRKAVSLAAIRIGLLPQCWKRQWL